MKTHFLNALSTTLCLALLAPGCSKKEQVGPEQPSVKVPPSPSPVPVPKVVIAPPQPIVVAAADSWVAIKDFTYEQRADFAAGMARMETQLDSQVSELNARRAAMTADTKEWDFNMGEMTKARSYLISIVAEVNGASPDTWSDKKEKFGQAWVRAQDAYDKVRTSTTN
jgi:hypothetical protein